MQRSVLRINPGNELGVHFPNEACHVAAKLCKGF